MERIWSDNQTLDYLLSLSDEDLANELAIIYDEDITAGKSRDELEDMLYQNSDSFFWEDMEDFDEGVLPQLQGQSKYDMIIITDGSDYGNVIEVDSLVSSDNSLLKNADEVALWDDNGEVVLSVDGKYYNLYAIPEETDEFIKVALPDWLDEYMDYYVGNSDIYGDNYTDEDALLDVADKLDDAHEIDQYILYDNVDSVCPKITWSTMTEGLDEAKRKQTAGTKNVSQLEMETAELEDIYENNGADSFYAMPFSEFQSRWPEFANSILISFLESMADYHIDEEPEDDTEEYWMNGDLITTRDWPTLFKGAHKIIDDGWNNFGWIAIWKDFYNKTADGENVFESVEDGEYKLCMELYPEDFSDVRMDAQEFGLTFKKTNEVVQGGPNDGAYYCYVIGDKEPLKQFAEMNLLYDPDEIESVIELA